MRDEENIGHIVRDKRTITSLSLSWKISAFCYFNFFELLYLESGILSVACLKLANLARRGISVHG